MFIKPLLLLALGVGTISLPMTDEALEQRDASASLASFDDDDTTCSQPYLIDQDSGKEVFSWTLSGGACVTLTTLGDRVGGSWGDIATIQVFKDSSCKEPQPGINISRIGAESSFCVPLSMFGCGSGGHGGDSCMWNSVMAQSIVRVDKAPNGPDSPSKNLD